MLSQLCQTVHLCTFFLPTGKHCPWLIWIPRFRASCPVTRCNFMRVFLQPEINLRGAETRTQGKRTRSQTRANADHVQRTWSLLTTQRKSRSRSPARPGSRSKGSATCEYALPIHMIGSLPTQYLRTMYSTSTQARKRKGIAGNPGRKYRRIGQHEPSKQHRLLRIALFVPRRYLIRFTAKGGPFVAETTPIAQADAKAQPAESKCT